MGNLLSLDHTERELKARAVYSYPDRELFRVCRKYYDAQAHKEVIQQQLDDLAVERAAVENRLKQEKLYRSVGVAVVTGESHAPGISDVTGNAVVSYLAAYDKELARADAQKHYCESEIARIITAGRPYETACKRLNPPDKLLLDFRFRDHMTYEKIVEALDATDPAYGMDVSTAKLHIARLNKVFPALVASFNTYADYCRTLDAPNTN